MKVHLQIGAHYTKLWVKHSKALERVDSRLIWYSSNSLITFYQLSFVRYH